MQNWLSGTVPVTILYVDPKDTEPGTRYNSDPVTQLYSKTLT